MSGYAATRAGLAALLSTAGVTTAEGADGTEPPGAIVYGDGVNLEQAGRGQAVAAFRITLLAGAWDGAAAAGILAGLIGTVLEALREAPAWALTDVGRDYVALVRGSQLLAADIRAATMIDL